MTVTAGTIAFTKAFTDDPVAPGGTVELEFNLRNLDRFDDATGITFTDDLDATLSGLVATGLPVANVCGPGSTLSGTSMLSLTGGSLAADGGSCTFSVTLQVPAGAAPGGYPNTTSALMATLGGSPFVGPPATETLFVSDAPTLTKTFLTSPVGAGDMVTVRFSLTNNSTTAPATGISFLDNLDVFLSGVSVASLPAAGYCGAGSTISAIIVASQLNLSVNGANLPAGGSCTFDVDLTIPAGTPGGSYVNTTGIVTASVGGMARLGRPASDTLVIAAGPSIQKEFTDDPVAPGGMVTLQFTLEHAEGAAIPATGITFTDDLAATLAGLTATGL
ncbi:MAG: Ig domain-containing protein, partial [Thermoanaerobaculia bacterium]|nr:Ig domain-containing protein [Thermoanaerobaculia bacterium]